MHPIAPRTLLILAGIVGLAVALQARSFFIAHVTGDQRLYVGLAMKLRRHGFGSYNLRQIDVRPQDGFVEFAEARPNDPEGDLLRALKEWGTPFYDQPLFHTPPLFPALLALSHRLFAANEDTFLVLGRAGESTVPTGRRFFRQFYAGVVPLASSALLVLACFLVGRTLASEEIGLLAAFLIAITPIQILAGQRLWADATLAALVTMSAWLVVTGRDRNGWAWTVGAALCLGLALLTKITAWLMVPAFLCAGWLPRQKGASQAPFWGIVALMTVPWYVVVWQTYGTPFFAPQQPGISQTHEWFALINHQPWYSYLVAVPLQLPLYLLGYFGAVWALMRCGREPGETMLAVWVWVWLVALMAMTNADEMLGPEQRYLLPAYPALAILTAQALATARIQLRERWGAVAANSVVAAVLVLSASWSLLVAWRSRGFDEIVLPF